MMKRLLFIVLVSGCSQRVGSPPLPGTLHCMKREEVVELGEAVVIDVEKFIRIEDGEINDVFITSPLFAQGYYWSEDFELLHDAYADLPVGRYPFEVTYGQQKQFFDIEVKDQKAPTIHTYITSLHLLVGESYDLLAAFEASDRSAFHFEVSEPIDTSIAHTQSIEVKAIDAFGNTSSQVVEVEVAEQVVFSPKPPIVVDALYVVNKTHTMPDDYVPPLVSIGGTHYLQPDAAKAFATMKNAIAQAQIPLVVVSSYRSKATQAKLYQSYVQNFGQGFADMYSAKPRSSEHELGLALDLNEDAGLDGRGVSTLHRWLAEHAHEYGYILRYPLGKEAITGYAYEPWHYRYVGEDIARILSENGWTLEEYYGMSTSP